MTRADLAHQVSLTLEGHAGDYDIDAIVSDIVDAHGMVANIDAVPTDTYWEIVERHDSSVTAAAEEFTALVGTSDSTVAGEYCDIEVTKEVGVGEPALKTELPVRVDDPDSLAKVETAADAALLDAGWKRTSEWEVEDEGLRATVERAEDYEAVVEIPEEEAKYVLGRAQDEGGLRVTYDGRALHLSAKAFGRFADGDNEINGYIDRAERLMWVGGLEYPVTPAKDIAEEPAGEDVVWSVVEGASPDADAVQPGPAGVTVPDAVLAWAENHGLSEGNPDIYLLVTTKDEAGQIDGELAYMEATAPTTEAAAIRAALADL